MDIKRYHNVIEQVNNLATTLEATPDLCPVARTILEPVLLNTFGFEAPRSRSHHAKRAPAANVASGTANPITTSSNAPISAARRRQLSQTAKKRWAAVKRSGQSTLGGGGGTT